MINFTLYTGPTGDLPMTDNHLVYRLDDGSCKILFSITKHGDAVSCHFSSDKAGLRKLKPVIDAWCQSVFCEYEWCKMIIAQVKRSSVARLIEKVGFMHECTCGEIMVYKRLR